MASYEYQLQFRKSTAHSNADALSCLPLVAIPDMVPDPPEVVLLMENLDSSPVCATDVKIEISRNLVLSHVLQFFINGWPDICDSDNLKPFWSRQLELSAQQGCLLWGNRVVVPPSLRQKYCNNCMTVTWEYHGEIPWQNVCLVAMF